MSARRSASVGALPQEKKHFVSRNESSSGVTLDVRCACQYFQSDSLLPERINPVDSRPSSKLGFHHDLACPQFTADATAGTIERNVQSPTMGFQPMRTGLVAGDRITQPEPERMSLHSVGKHRSWDQASASVDISFVEKYPELEETARTRGLVMRSISDDDPNTMPGTQRPRFTSVDRLSRDPETLSMHSVRSLRRIPSRSPSKQDLYVADIIIPTTRPPLYGRREQRSVSASRRSSNMDLTTFSPQINVITPTPLPQATNRPPSFPRDVSSPVPAIADRQRSYSRDFTPLRSMSPPGGLGYSKAKPPTSLDYMRPDENKENVLNYQAREELLPQNRPIDITKYKTSGDGSTTGEQLVPQNNQIGSSESMQRDLSPIRSPSPPEIIDFRNAKPPMSTDYMRPNENKDGRLIYQLPGETLPQNRPIDMSKYKTSPEASTIVEPEKMDLQTTDKPFDPLQQTVAELEAMQYGQNLVDIRDNIKIQRLSPPLLSDVPTVPLNVDEETRIEINSQVPIVDIDKLVKEEEEKASSRSKSPGRYLETLATQERQGRSRSASPSRGWTPATTTEQQGGNNRARSPPKQTQHFSMDNLQLPEANYHQLKREHSPERQPSPTRIKRSVQNNAKSSNDEEGKTSYATRFKTFFSSKPKEDANDTSKPDNAAIVRQKTPVRERSPSPMPPTQSRFSSMFSKEKSPMREKSPTPSKFSKEKSPMREKSPSPAKQTSSKFMSMFSKEKPTALSVVSGTNAAITNKSQAEPMSIKVVETFSLKVDEMDQYMAKPNKTMPPPPSSLSKSPSVQKSFGSRDEFLPHDQEHSAMDIREAFAPIIIGRSSTEDSSKFLADKRTSRSELSSQDRGLEMRGWSREPSIHHHPELQGKPLYSAAIMMSSSGSINQTAPNDRRMQMHGVRSPSEQRPLLPYKDQKGDFFEGRTQSTDRHRIGGSQDNLSLARISKTVSFNFDERKSRLGQFESSTLPAQKQEFLERTYFSR